jgi:hypothetical protein
VIDMLTKYVEMVLAGLAALIRTPRALLFGLMSLPVLAVATALSLIFARDGPEEED